MVSAEIGGDICDSNELNLFDVVSCFSKLAGSNCGGKADGSSS